MVETFETANAELCKRAAELREDARQVWIEVNHQCIHTPLAEEIRLLVEEGQHAVLCAKGFRDPDDEFNVGQAARAAEAFSHDECVEKQSTAKRLEQAADYMMGVAVYKCETIRDLSQIVLRSALDLRIAEDRAPWFRYFFTDYKD
jgi:hypothetical protein